MHVLASLAVAAAAAGPAKDPPLIDLDSTVLLQLVLFLVTAFILSKALFKPYLAVRAAREEGIEGARDEARRMDEQAQAQTAEYETAYAKAKLKANEERGKLRGEGAAREREIVDAARRTTQAAVEQARAKLAQSAAETRAAMEPRAKEIAAAMAKKILGREVA